jgi:hypothetical protein
MPTAQDRFERGSVARGVWAERNDRQVAFEDLVYGLLGGLRKMGPTQGGQTDRPAVSSIITQLRLRDPFRASSERLSHQRRAEPAQTTQRSRSSELAAMNVTLLAPNARSPLALRQHVGLRLDSHDVDHHRRHQGEAGQPGAEVEHRSAGVNSGRAARSTMILC